MRHTRLAAVLGMLLAFPCFAFDITSPSTWFGGDKVTVMGRSHDTSHEVMSNGVTKVQMQHLYKEDWLVTDVDLEQAGKGITNIVAGQNVVVEDVGADGRAKRISAVGGGGGGIDADGVDLLIRTYDSTNLTPRISSKQDVLTAGSNITIQVVGGQTVISATGGGGSAIDWHGVTNVAEAVVTENVPAWSLEPVPTITNGLAKLTDLPQKVSDLTNDAEYVTKAITNGILSAANAYTDFATNGLAMASDIPQRLSDLTNDTEYVTKAVTNGLAPVAAIPTKVSQLTNDSDYVYSVQAGEGISVIPVTGGFKISSLGISTGTVHDVELLLQSYDATNLTPRIDAKLDITNAVTFLDVTNVVDAATNGLVTASVTNGLATVAYVDGATNGLVTAAVTNGLASITYVDSATNGLVTVAVTNGLASLVYVNDATNSIVQALTNKADKATTLAGYGITNAYTKAEADAITNAVTVAAQWYTDDALTNYYKRVDTVAITTNGVGIMGVASVSQLGDLPFLKRGATVYQPADEEDPSSGATWTTYTMGEIDYTGKSLKLPVEAGTLALLSDIPHTVSALTNDIGYVTEAVTNGLASASQLPPDYRLLTDEQIAAIAAISNKAESISLDSVSNIAVEAYETATNLQLRCDEYLPNLLHYATNNHKAAKLANYRAQRLERWQWDIARERAVYEPTYDHWTWEKGAGCPDDFIVSASEYGSQKPRYDFDLGSWGAVRISGADGILYTGTPNSAPSNATSVVFTFTDVAGVQPFVATAVRQSAVDGTPVRVNGTASLAVTEDIHRWVSETKRDKTDEACYNVMPVFSEWEYSHASRDCGEDPSNWVHDHRYWELRDIFYKVIDRSWMFTLVYRDAIEEPWSYEAIEEYSGIEDTDITVFREPFIFEDGSLYATRTRTDTIVPDTSHRLARIAVGAASTLVKFDADGNLVAADAEDVPHDDTKRDLTDMNALSTTGNFGVLSWNFEGVDCPWDSDSGRWVNDAHGYSITGTYNSGVWSFRWQGNGSSYNWTGFEPTDGHVPTFDTLALASQLPSAEQLLTDELRTEISKVKDKADEFTEWEFEGEAGKTYEVIWTDDPILQPFWSLRVFEMGVQVDSTIAYLPHDSVLIRSTDWLDVLPVTATRKRVLRTGDAATPQELEGKVSWANAAHSAITIGSRASGSNIGNFSLAQGYDVKAEGDSAHAEGQQTTADGLAAHAEGYGAHAEGIAAKASGIWTTAGGKDPDPEDPDKSIYRPASIAAGWGVEATSAGAFAWQGLPDGRDPLIAPSNTEVYVDNGPGTFSVNPVGGLEGVYVGDKNLKEHIREVVTAEILGRIHIVQRADGFHLVIEEE